MTIVSIRGTHGSGKSTICRKILDRYNGQPVMGVDARGRPAIHGYTAELPSGDLFIVGRYDIACGGCDAVQPYAEIWPRVEKFAGDGYHVLFEGALVSSSYGTIGAGMQRLQDDAGVQGVFAFLDTPLEECLRRIGERRKAKGNFEPLNPHNTTVKFDNVARTKDQMRRLGSTLTVVDIDHQRPVQQVLKLFGTTIRKEPV